MRHVSRALRYLRPYWRLAVVSVVLVLLSGLTSLLIPWPLKILVDSVLQSHPLPPLLAPLLGADRTSLLAVVIAGGLAVTLFSNVLTVADNYVNTRIHQGMTLDFRSDLFQHAHRLSLPFHDRSRAGTVIYSVNFLAEAAARLVMTIPPLAQSAITLVGMFWIIFRIDRTLALLTLTVVPFLYYSVGYYIRHVQSRLLEVKGMEGETLSIVHEAMSMLRVIVAFAREDHEYRRFRTQGERAVDARVQLTVRQTLFALAVNMITAAGTALVLGFGALQALQGRLTVGQLLVVIAYLAAVYKPLEAISTTIGSLQDQLVSLRMAFDLMDVEPQIRDLPGAVAVRRARGQVVFDSVNFSYADRVATLKNVSLAVGAGQVAAVVGPTGAGKTTLVSLIPRFYQPSSGRILLDGTDVRGLTLRSLREQISLVLQEPLLFSGTIAENIRYGRLDADAAEVIAAAKDANAHDFIAALPEGYDTRIGERGAQLSAGERQRVAVARAFLKDAPILILDEPTSAIDSRTEAVILDALDRLMVGRTTFIVAHRLSTIRHADVIFVLQRGEVVERGSHESLLERQGLYRQLYDVQSGAVRRRVLKAVEPLVRRTTEIQP